ncbi:MAG: EAL domain-containing protein [Alphaproteobacteria bacterium]|nr:MAG: EAL domain-containing protein [Alphaproteobacteria bacterium]
MGTDEAERGHKAWRAARLVAAIAHALRPWRWPVRVKLAGSFLLTMLILGKASHDGIVTMRAAEETMALVERRYSEDVPQTLLLARETEAINMLAHALAGVSRRDQAESLAAEIAQRLERLEGLLARLAGSDLADDWTLDRLRTSIAGVARSISTLVITVEESIAARAQSQRINRALIAADERFEGAFSRALADFGARVDDRLRDWSAALAGRSLGRMHIAAHHLAAAARLMARIGSLAAAAARGEDPRPGLGGLAAALDPLPRAGPAWVELHDSAARLAALVAADAPAERVLAGLGEIAALAGSRALLGDIAMPAAVDSVATDIEGVVRSLARLDALLSLRAEISTALGMQLSAAGALTAEEVEVYLRLFEAARANAQAWLRALDAARRLPDLYAATVQIFALGGRRGIFDARRAELSRREGLAALIEGMQAEVAAISADVGVLVAAAGGNATLASAAMNARLDEGRRQLGALAVVGALLSGLVALGIMRSVSGPVRTMTRAMIRIARGSYDLHIPGRERSDEFGEMARALEVFARAMRDLARSRDDLRRAALTDPATGLRNRRGLAEDAREMAANARPGQRLAVMHVDLDRFKAVNDTLGHEAGDHVLANCARILCSETRVGDIVARVGGDEFVIICRDVRDRERVAGIAQRLIRRLSEPVPFRDRVCQIGASIGVAMWDATEVPDPERPLADADIALYEAKRGGRGRFSFFEPAMRERVETGARLAEEIRRGLERGEFEPWFQPQVDLRDGALAGFEALVRWRHPERGLLGPDRFIGAAAEAGLLDRLDERMLEEVCAALTRLRRAGLPAPQVSVNLSQSRLADPGVIDQVKWTVDRAGLQPGDVALEILETVLLDDRAAHAAENIRRFAAAGFAIELDDFGTGHASISNLRNFPVHRMKIDRSFVAGVDQDHELRMMTGALARLGANLGLQVLAEGVETEGELVTVRALGCAWAQGFLIARPMPYVELTMWLRGRGSHPLREMLARLDRDGRLAAAG